MFISFSTFSGRPRAEDHHLLSTSRPEVDRELYIPYYNKGAFQIFSKF
nr:hypothetical protein [uncultured Prevotella sp.]